MVKLRYLLSIDFMLFVIALKKKAQFSTETGLRILLIQVLIQNRMLSS